MQYQDFYGKKISTLGLGGLRFPAVDGDPNRIDRAAGQKVVDAAMQQGINVFDTAWSYQDGDSERFLGEALTKYPRESFLLGTKFYVAYSSDIEMVFETQLKRCGVDYFDFYMLHCLDEDTISDYMDPNKGYLNYLLRQKEAGRIGRLGFSSHAAPETLERFLNWYDDFDMALIQLNYLDWNLLDGKRQYELLTEHDIPVWVMEPMKGGSLSTLNEKAAGILKEAAPTASLSSWGFRFLQGLPGVQTVFSGMSDVSQVIENATLFGAPKSLSAAERKTLQRAADAFLKTMGVPCSGCRYCCGICPAGLEIPLLIKGYNEQNITGSTWKIGMLSETKGASACLSCGACLSRCPQKIDILGVMKKLAEQG